MSDGLSNQCKRCRTKKIALPSGKKKCSVCNRILNASPENFYRCAREKDGFAYVCKACKKPSERAQYSKWLAKNPEKNRIKARNYEARKRGAEGKYTSTDIELLMKLQHGLCWWCGVSLDGKYHIDHRNPISRGGSNNPSNLCLSCSTCNQSKGDKMPWEFNGRLL